MRRVRPLLPLIRVVDAAAWIECINAEIAFRRGFDAEAEQGFRRALALEPSFPEAHHGLSLVFAEKDRLDSALEHSLFARGGTRPRLAISLNSGTAM